MMIHCRKLARSHQLRGLSNARSSPLRSPHSARTSITNQLVVATHSLWGGPFFPAIHYRFIAKVLAFDEERTLSRQRVMRWDLIAAAITSAHSCMEWLAHEPPNLDRAREAAARIDKYGNRAAEIIDRIRSFYRKSPAKRELVDVNGIVQEMLTLMKDEAIRYSIAIRTELAAALPKIIADRVQLQQVFMNLMLNAIEAMKTTVESLRSGRKWSKLVSCCFRLVIPAWGCPRSL